MSYPAFSELNGTPNVAVEFVKDSQAVDTDWLPSNVTVRSPKYGRVRHRISVWLKTANSVVKLMIKSPATLAGEAMTLNGGTAITAGRVYSEDVYLPTGWSYNIQHPTTAQKVACWIVPYIDNP